MRGAAVAAATAISTAALGGCGGTDAPALSGPAPVATAPSAAGAGGPAVSVVAVGSVEAPVISGGKAAAVASATARQVATSLAAAGRTCPVRVVTSSPKVVSLRWDCTDRSVTTATFSTATGAELQLPDLLQGAWAAYLSSTAQAQLEAGGATPTEAAAAAPADPTAALYRRFALTADALELVCTLPTGPATLDFPLATLTTYLRPGAV